MKISILSRFAVLVAAAAAFAGCSKQAREGRLFSRAEKDFAAGEYDKAEVEYQGALQLARDPRVLGRLGILYFNEGRMIEAFPYLKRSADLAPQQVDLRVKLGLAYLEFGVPKDAREAAKAALSVDPANAEAMLLLVDSCRSKQDVEDARKLIEGLRNGHPDCAGFHLALGTLSLFQGDQPNAESELRKAIELDPKSASAHMELGNLFVLRRDVKQAGDEFQAAAQLAPMRSPLRLRYLDFLFATKRADEAKKELAEINQKVPDYVPGLVYSMKLALAERRYADCEDFIQKVLMRDSQNYDALMERGVINMAKGDPARAVAELTKAENIYGRSPQIKYQLALAYLSQGDVDKAEDRLNQALSAVPGFDQARLLLAELDLRKGNPAPVVASLTGLIQRRPRTARAYILLAQAYIAEKSPDQALATYAQMAALFPKDPQAPYLTGVLLSQQNQRAEAREEFEKALQIDATYAPALDMLVNADLADRHIDAAGARVGALLDKYPKSAGPWLLQAKVDFVRKDLDATEADLLKAIDLDPTGETAYLELAQVYVTAHKPAKAVEKLAALADKSRNPQVLMQLGILHTSLNQYDAARADYEKLISFDPKFGPALNNLAYLYSEHLGKLDLAYDFAKRARDAAPDNANAADTLGWILYRRGDFQHALDLVQECVQKEPENFTALYHLGMIHYMLGDEDPARQAFQRAIAGAGAVAAWLEDARGRLALLAIDPAHADRATLADLKARAGTQPDDPIVLARLAAVEALQGASADAAEHYEALLKLTPENTAAMLDLAQLYAGPLRDLSKARVLARSAHELAPNDAQISQTLGRLLYRTGDYQWSLDLLTEAVRGLPDEPDLQYDLALDEYCVGRVSDAEGTLNDLLGGGGVFSRREEAGRLAAMIVAGKSPADAEAALPEAKRILAGDPSYLPAMTVSALALEKEGDSSGAAAAYETILAQDPAFLPAIRQLALIYSKHPGADQKAYDFAFKAREAFPEDASVATALGIADYRRADYTGAIGLFQDSLSRQAGDAETTYYLGMSHLNLKEDAKAKAELKQSLELKLPNDEAADAKQALAGLK